MASTRIFDSSARQQYKTQDSTFAGQYHLEKPGPGASLPYHDDIFTRMTHWGANLCHANGSIGSNAGHIDIESDLRGQTRKLVRKDWEEGASYMKHAVSFTPMPILATSGSHTDDSRTTHPAWAYRVMNTPQAHFPVVDPQYMAGKELFHRNLNTRILERDYYFPTADGSVQKL